MSVGYLSIPLLGGAAGARQTASWMAGVIAAATNDPAVRFAAETILDQAGVGPTDYARQAEAILRRLATWTTYTKDPRVGLEEQQLIATPAWLFEQIGQGKRPRLGCVGLTVFSLALLGSVGFPTMLRMVSTRDDQQFDHVFGVVEINGVWQEADVTRWYPVVHGRWPARRPTTREEDVAIR